MKLIIETITLAGQKTCEVRVEIDGKTFISCIRETRQLAIEECQKNARSYIAKITELLDLNHESPIT